jgi:hypothetical protein
MTKKKPRYESRVFDGRIIHSAEIERIHKEVLDFKHIEAISEPMRELIECRPRTAARGRGAEDFHRPITYPEVWPGVAWCSRASAARPRKLGLGTCVPYLTSAPRERAYIGACFSLC